MKKKQFFQSVLDGLSGKVHFALDGRRSNFDIIVYELVPHGRSQVYKWNNTSEGLVNIRPPVDNKNAQVHFRIISALVMISFQTKTETTLYFIVHVCFKLSGSSILHVKGINYYIIWK